MTTVLMLVLPVNLLLLLSLFALTGYNAPTALVLDEDTPLARGFVAALENTHHSFDLRPMSLAVARRQLQAARLVAIIEIPPGFDAGIRAGQTVGINLIIDNVNLDLTEDIRRAVPAAAAIFAERQGFPQVRLRADLRNVLAGDTGYVEYLGVSAIVLAACIAGGVLGGTVTAREWELGTARLLVMTPRALAPALAGRLAAAAVVGTAASVATALVVWFGYGVAPAHAAEAFLAVVCTVVAATALGGLVGARVRRVLPVAPLLLGATLPFYLDSGALEPQRFDGPWLFAAAHLSPAYYGVGAIEHAFHDLSVTPEPTWVLLTVLLGCAAVATAAAARVARS
ncbi:MAG: ABC transporter permease [Mycobacteriales bacterium]